MTRMSVITGTVLLLCCCVFSVAVPRPHSSTPVLDQIIFGDAASEESHDFAGPGTLFGSTSILPIQYPQYVTYRQVGADPVHTQNQTITGNQSTFITVTIRVHPTLPTYITLKMYGSDNQTCAIMLYWRPPQQPPIQSLYPGMISIGSGLLQLGWFYPPSGTQASGYGPIELVNRGINSFPRHFHYSSSVLPKQLTANQSSLRILLGGWGNVNGYFFPNLEPLTHDLKPIYRLYTHIDPFYEPLPSPSNDEQAADIDHYEPHTIEPIPQTPAYPLWTQDTRPVPQEELLANYTVIQKSIDSTITNTLNPTGNSQVYGPQWNATLDIYNPENPYATPSVLWGAPSIGFGWTKNNLTHDQWLNRAAFATTNPNNVPLEVFAVLALAYRAEWSIHYRDPTILYRIVVGLDYYMHQQGSDGGFLATSPNVGWRGAPNRTTGLGSPLDGTGPYALGHAVVLLYDVLDATGRLDQTVDYNLDGKRIRRREGWWLMFNANIQGTFAVQGKRGGCPNQDLMQVQGLLLSNKACALLLPGTHPPLTDDDVRSMVNQATGFTTQARYPQNGPFFTDTGMTMECFGVNGGGGLEFNYGNNVLALLINIQLELDPIVFSDVYERSQLAFNHYIRYIYSGYQENDQLSPLGSPHNPPLLRHPTTIDTRGDYQPDVILPANAMFATLYHAVTNKNGYALRVSHIQYMQNLWWSTPLTYDAMITMFHLWDNFTDIIHNAYDNRYFDTKILPSELSIVLNGTQINDTPNSAFVEITAAGANIKYGHERLLININYRHALNAVSGLAKVLHHGMNASRVATVAFNSTDGFWGLWTLNFGNYFISINRNKNSSYDFHALQYNAQSRYVLDLPSGKHYDLETMPAIPAWTAWVWVPSNQHDGQYHRMTV